MRNDGPAVGTLWQGEYLLQAALGDPTHGVFRAQRRRDSQNVTIRFWRAPNDSLAREFLEHASAAISIRHPTLAHLEACGREEHFCFLVTEYLVGQKLDTWADQVGIPPLGEVIELMRRLCEGLAIAARSGVYHSALHPRNVVMLQGDGPSGRRAHPKLLDLGWPTLARPRAPSALAAQFMAPEQLVTVLEPSQPPLPQANATMNVYSCGALLYYLCTGGPPYRHAELAALRDAHVQSRLVLPSRINPQITQSLNAVIFQALALDPKARFASLAELGEALARVSLTPSVATARPVLSSVPPRAGTMPPRAAAPSRASAVGLKRISPPPAISIPPGISRRPPPPAASEFGPEPVTAKTGPVAAITHRPPPAPGDEPSYEELSEERDRSNAPAGSFSSHPPPRSSPPPKPPRAVLPTPLALFSGAPNVRPGDQPEPVAPHVQLESSPGQILGAQDVITARPPRDEKRPPLMWLGALAAVACAAMFGVVRLLGSSPPQADEHSPTVTLDQPAVDPGSANPETVAQAPAGAAPEAPQLEPEPEPEPEPDPDPHSPPAIAHSESEADDDEASSARSSRSRGARTSSTGASSIARDPRPPSPAPVFATRELPAEVDAAPPRPLEIAPAPAPTAPSQPEPPPHAAEPDPPVAVTPKARAPEPPPEPIVTAAPAPEPPPPPRPAPAPQEKLPLEAKTAIGEVSLRGSLPTSWVKRAVERLVPQFAACYERAARAAGKNQFGSVSVEVELDERGRARSPRARGAKLAGLNDCVAEAASKVISERAPDTGTVHASFKVNFSP